MLGCYLGRDKIHEILKDIMGSIEVPTKSNCYYYRHCGSEYILFDKFATYDFPDTLVVVRYLYELNTSDCDDKFYFMVDQYDDRENRWKNKTYKIIDKSIYVQ